MIMKNLLLTIMFNVAALIAAAAPVLAASPVFSVDREFYPYRQADQKVAEALLAAVPKDIDLQQTYGLKEVPALPVVDMVVWQVNVETAK